MAEKKYIEPKDVPEKEAKEILGFLNAVKTAKEIAEAVEFLGERDIGVKTAQNILDAREKLGKFTELQQVAEVRQVGPERFTELVTTLKKWVVSRVPPIRIKQAEVPIELRRKAAQYLESLRSTETAPEVALASLSDGVCPIFRPDIDSVAYYEFEVNLGTGKAQRVITKAALATLTHSISPFALSTRLASSTPPSPAARGFIILSTTGHDYPIAHWSLESEPISRQLQDLAANSGKTVSKIYKLDALSYVAEDAGGKEVARVGPLPLPVKGLPGDLRQAEGKISSAETRLSVSVSSDEEAANVNRSIQKTGPEPPDIEVLDIGGWEELKKRYAEVFKPFLDDLKRRAASDWEIDNLIAEFGEGIAVGEPHRVALLQPEAVAELSGEAAGIVDLRLIESAGAPPVLEMYVQDSPFGREADVDLHIAYSDGVEEHLKFFVVSREDPSNERIEPVDFTGPGVSVSLQG
jgi:hypothetical protein